MTSRLWFVDEYLFNNQYSFLINNISIILHITSPINTNLIYVIVITAKDQIKFLSFRQIWEKRYNTYNFFKESLSGESSLGQTIEKWSSSSLFKEQSGKIRFSTGFFLHRPCSINSLLLLIITLTKLDISSLSKSKSNIFYDVYSVLKFTISAEFITIRTISIVK